ncbi:hypothetical protein EDB83DRAFT_2315872 [Lactarius deliciosus]|nr:hypothetical protein EDB83DRAFT_2315872 [Lactarius deliciosus]
MSAQAARAGSASPPRLSWSPGSERSIGSRLKSGLTVEQIPMTVSTGMGFMCRFLENFFSYFRFEVWHDSLNRTQFRFGVQKNWLPNPTAPDRSNPNMKGSDLDTYTATFQNLTTRAGYTLDTVATVDLYLGGLPCSLLTAILKCDTQPETFTQWTDATQTEQRKWANIVTCGLYDRKDRNDNCVNGRTRNKWHQQHASNIGGGRSMDQNTPPHDPNAMDMDHTCIMLTNEERQRCFDEHREVLPEKASNQGMGGVTTIHTQDNQCGTTSTHIAKVEPAEMPPPPMNIRKPETTVQLTRDNMLAQVRAMKYKEQEKILNTLFTGEDF